MALKGNLAEFGISRLIDLIGLAKKTGTLVLYSPTVQNDERAAIYFWEGRLILASAGTQDGQLTTMLLKSGKLTLEQADVLNERGTAYTDKALALMLINANCVTRDDIIQSVRQYTLDIVYDVMTWNQGTFHFEDDMMPLPERITVSIDVKKVIAEGTRRIQEIKPLERDLPSLDAALKFPNNPGDLFQGISLGVEEWRVVSLINPKSSIRQIATGCHMTETEIRRVVYGLLQKGLVEVVHPPKPRVTPMRRVAAMLSLL